MKFLDAKKINELVDLDELREAMAKALASISSGETSHIPRNVACLNLNNALGVMPAYNELLHIAGYKAVTVYPGNRNLDLNPHQGIMVLMNYETGEIKSLLDGSELTALRTAAVSAMATDLLSRKDSSILTIIGAGRQAYEHFVSISRVREIKKVQVFNRSIANAEKLIKQIQKVSEVDVKVESDINHALQDADIIVSCTSAKEPLFATSVLKSGAHVNAVGSCRPGSCEIQLSLRENLNIFVDNFLACTAEADELLVFRGHLQNYATEIGQVINGQRPGRKKENEVTFFKSVGIAAEDLFAAELIFQKDQSC